MIAEIAYELIKSIAEQLSFADKWGGLVTALKKKDGDKNITFPAFQNTDITCDTSDYIDLTPNSDKASVLYAEKNGYISIKPVNRNINIASAPIRVVCWYNLNRINEGKFIDESVISSNVIDLIPKSLPDTLFTYCKNVSIEFVGISFGAEIFKAYTYDEIKTQFCTFPYGAVAIDLEIQYTPIKCNDQITPKEACGMS
jgi:hypothetical protein